MATIKAYTDISQSKKLAKILSLENADMYYPSVECNIPKIGIPLALSSNIPAWSLAALMDILPAYVNEDYYLEIENFIMKKEDQDTWMLSYVHYSAKYDAELETESNSIVDACVEMIVKLKEKNLL